MSWSVNWTKQWSKWHQKLGWWGAFAVLVWALSGVAHPLMSWLGPQAVKFYPPSLQLVPGQYEGLKNVIQVNGLDRARMLKVIPSESEALVQLTKGDNQPRRYFSLVSSVELPNHDQQQAKWLASYYTGRDIDEIADVEWLTEFSPDYPSVNRLLPVYRVHFSGNAGLMAYIYTETNALATLTNDNRQQLQTVFQVLHTWSWLNEFDNSRVLLMGFFMLALMAMCVAGIGLIVVLKSRRIPQASRRWHRVFSYILWLPLLGWSVSGFYHLLQAAYIEPVSGLRLSEEMRLDNRDWADMAAHMGEYQNQSINALVLVEGASDAAIGSDEETTLFYRLSLSQPNNQTQHTRSERFSGKASERSAVYIDAKTGQFKQFGDEAQAQYLALRHTGRNQGDIVEVSKVTHFGPDYDFRNKRLPVWRIEFSDEVANGDAGLRVFVDPITGVLVDQNRQIDRAESWSFSILHKWNHLNPITGRFYRDVLIVGTLALCFVMTLFGVLMLLNNRRRKKVGEVQPANPAFLQ